MEAAGRRASRYWHYGLLLLVVVFFGLIRWHLRNVPLERDEGEYAYAGQLILHGVPPYAALYSMKLPGTFAGYALILAIFGQTIAGIHLGLLVINAATTLLVFLLGKRLFGPLAGLVAGASYALLSTSPAVVGFAAHATNFVVLPAVAGILLLLKATETRRSWLYFWSGVLFGLAFLKKQPGILFAVFGAVYLAYCEWQTSPRDWRGVLWKEAVYAGGVVLPFAITCLILLASGAFSKFWFWTFVYAREYATTTGIGEGLGVLRIMLPSVVLPGLWIWVLAGVGLTAVAWNRQARERRFVLISFLLFSILAVCPGLYFRGHYFILMLPAIALLVGVAVSSVSERIQEKSPANARPWLLPALIFLAAFANTIYVQREYLFRMDSWNASKVIYGANPFPEAVEVAGYLKDHATPGARIAVLGSEPGNLFLFRPALGYRLHLHLRPDGAAALRAPDAKGNDRGNRGGPARVHRLRGRAAVVRQATGLRGVHLPLDRQLSTHAVRHCGSSRHPAADQLRLGRRCEDLPAAVVVLHSGVQTKGILGKRLRV